MAKLTILENCVFLQKPMDPILICRKLWDAVTSSVNRVPTGNLIFTISAVKGNADFFHIPIWGDHMLKNDLHLQC